MSRRKTNPHELIEDTFAAMSLTDQEALLRVLAYIHRQTLADEDRAIADAARLESGQ